MRTEQAPLPGQIDLFDVRTPFQRHSRTSRLAAQAIRPKALNLRDQVLAFIRSRPGGATDAEVAAAFPNRSENALRPRRVDLSKRGDIYADGTRLTPAGREATVWRAR